MDFLADLDFGVLVLVCGCCIALVFFGGIISFALGVVGAAFDIIGSVVGIILDILGGGPVAWCGCLVAIVILLGCGGVMLALANALSTCGTPEAVNFCRIFS